MYATQDREGEEAKPKTGSAAVGFHAGPWYSGEHGAAGASQAGNVKALPNESSALPFEHEGTFASTAQQTHSLWSCPATRQQH